MKLLAILIVVVFASCATPKRPGGYYQDDGPDRAPPADVMQVPDAVPRDEPLSPYGNKPYTVFNVDYVPMASAAEYRERGIASWYGKKFHRKPTSSREPYDMYAMSAAHKTLPLPSYVRVRNLENGRTVVVRVNDRGPFLHNRVIDLSYAAAARLGILGKGTGLVEVSGVMPDRPAGPGVSASVDARPPRLFLQVGAFSRQTNAGELRSRLEGAGLAPVMVAAAPAGNAMLYRVRIGPIPNVAESDRLAGRLRALGFPEGQAVVE